MMANLSPRHKHSDLFVHNGSEYQRRVGPGRAHTHCFISWSPVYAGSSAAHHEYARALARAGHVVTVVGRGEEPPHHAEKNLYIYPIRANARYETAAHGEFLVAAARHLRMQQYDFVDAMLSPGIGVLPLAARRYNKAVWVLHIRTSAIQHSLGGWFRNALARVELNLFDAATIIDRNIAPLLFISGKKSESLLELPLGVNPERMKACDDQRNVLFGENIEGKKILIYVGKTDPTRRLDRMIEAFAIIKQKYADVMLAIVGGGGDAGVLKATARKFNVLDSVILCGYVDYSQVSRYISSADIALTYIPISPTYQWQPALKALEYLQIGLPQVATATSANAKYIEHEVNGLLASDEPDQFADQVMRLLEDQSLYDAIKHGCSRGIEKHYWGNIAEQKLIPFYDRLFPVTTK